MNICLYRIDYTIDGNHDYSVNILAENGEAAIKKIVQILQRPITVRTIDTVCVGIQLATNAVEKIISDQYTQKNHKITEKVVENVETEKVDGRKTKIYKCPYCEFETKSGLGLASHKKHKHFVEWTREKESKNEN